MKAPQCYVYTFIACLVYISDYYKISRWISGATAALRWTRHLTNVLHIYVVGPSGRAV